MMKNLVWLMVLMMVLILCVSVFSAGVFLRLGNANETVREENKRESEMLEAEIDKDIHADSFLEKPNYSYPSFERGLIETGRISYHQQYLEQVFPTPSKNSRGNQGNNESIRDDYTPRDPIWIRDDVEFHEKAKENDWPGTGEQQDPYIIEGYEIDSEGIGTGIFISQTSVHFELKNNYIHSAETYGIAFEYVENGIISDNILSNNGFDFKPWESGVRGGIWLGNSRGVHLSNNTIQDNAGSSGVDVVGSYEITWINNTIIHDTVSLHFWLSGENTLVSNKMIGGELFISGDTFGHWHTHEIDTTNTVNGDPVYYWKNRTGGTVPQGAGQVILANSTGVTIENQNITGASISIGFSWNNTVENNNIADSFDGIRLERTTDIKVENNTISSVDRGITLIESWNNNFANNTMKGTGFYITEGLKIGPWHWSWHEIDTSNTVNGDPVYYWKNRTGGTVPPGAGQVILANSTGVTIENQNITGGGIGILVGHSSENNITDNQIVNNRHGLYFARSGENRITSNTISDNEYGYFAGESPNILLENNVTGNTVGFLIYSQDSIIYHNRFIGNEYHAYDAMRRNNWNKPYPIGGNYWDDHIEPDEYSGPGQDEPGSDGIVDVPRNIMGEAKDEYPWTNPTISSSPRILDPEPSNEETETPVNTTLSVEIESDDYPVEVEFYLDDTLKYSEEIEKDGRVETGQIELEYNTTYKWNVEANSQDKGNRTVSPTYSFDTEPLKYELKVNVEGEGTVEVDGEEIVDGTTFVYRNGTEVDLKAAADEGWIFDEWTGEIDSVADPKSAETTITMYDDYEITAHFEEAEEFDLAVEIGDGEGEVRVSYDNVEETVIDYETFTIFESTTVTLEAEPADGFEFDRWEGDVEEEVEKITIEMDDDKELTAHFEIKTYVLDVEIVGEGTVDVEPEREEYEEGTEVTLTAVPDEGWHFHEWTGDAEGTEEEITIVMDDDKEITAVFEEIQTYELTVDVEGEGDVVVEPEREEYEEGTEVTLTAVPDEGWLFVEWTGAHESTDENITMVMDSDKEITAWFEEDVEYHELEVNIEGEGSVERELDQEEYEHGTEVTLTAVPAEGWYFEEWSGDETTTEVEITVTMDEDKTITAHFEELDPAEFEFSALTVEPEEPELGEEVEISVDVTNVGELEGEYTVEFHVNDALIDEVDVELEAGETETVSTSYEVEEEGEYDIEAEDMSITFTVEEVTTDGWLIVAIVLSVIALIVFVWMGMRSDEKTSDKNTPRKDNEEEENDEED